MRKLAALAFAASFLIASTGAALAQTYTSPTPAATAAPMVSPSTTTVPGGAPSTGMAAN